VGATLFQVREWRYESHRGGVSRANCSAAFVATAV
jgi:hypothetical protein